MKKIFLSTCFLISTIFLFAQKQANIWYFGNNIGLDFNQTPPQPLNNGNISCTEGTAVIADNNGKLLFYTNGFVIMNRQHVKMKNGQAIAGHPSSTNNAVIVPLPGNDSIYYVFTVGASDQLSQQFQYNIVNIKGDNGLGEVDPAGMNIIVEDTIFEKLAAVKHCNNRDVWIVVHKWDTDEYHSYLLTASGLSTTPVISNTGFVINGAELNELGTLKFSANGTKMAAAHSFENDAVELMDFDNTTGKLSNPIIIHPNVELVSLGAYGAEFSPNGKLLYVTSVNYSTDTSVLYQFDVSSNNTATIMASRQIIYKDNVFSIGSLQSGPDLKIYMTLWNSRFLSTINNPDVYGAGCNFVLKQINFLGPDPNAVQFGLPTFMQSYFDTTANPYDFKRLGNCSDLNVIFKINRLNGIDSVKWNFGDGQFSQSLQPTNTYASSGFYDVGLIVYKVDCSGLNDTIIRRIWVADKTDLLGNDTLSCNPVSLNLSVDIIEGANYLWGNGYTGTQITTSGYGFYWVEIDQNGCKLRDSVEVRQKARPLVNLGVDTSVCQFKSIILQTGNTIADSYAWSTGETSPSIRVEKTGAYYVTVKEADCFASDTVLVSAGDCDVFLPSAFTPNQDKLNDEFGVVGEVTLQYYKMQVFSKWGELIFNSNDIAKKWDGKFKGKDMPNGSYLWTLTYVNRKGRKFYEQGTVMLIR